VSLKLNKYVDRNRIFVVTLMLNFVCWVRAYRLYCKDKLGNFIVHLVRRLV